MENKEGNDRSVLRALCLVSCRHVRMEVVGEASNMFLIRIKLFFITKSFVFTNIYFLDLCFALVVNKASTCCIKVWSSLVHPSTCKCPQLGWKQLSYGPRLSLPGRKGCSLALAAGTSAQRYCLGFSAILQRFARRRCFGMGVCSPSHLSHGQRVGFGLYVSVARLSEPENRDILLGDCHTSGCILLTFPLHLPCLHGCLYALPWTRQKTEVGSSYVLEVLSKADSSTACLKLNAWPVFPEFYIYTLE